MLNKINEKLKEVVSTGKFEATKCLLELGADPNSKNDSWSPLKTAVVKGYFDIARLLLQYGAEKESFPSLGKGYKSLIESKGLSNNNPLTFLSDPANDVFFETDIVKQRTADIVRKVKPEIFAEIEKEHLDIFKEMKVKIMIDVIAIENKDGMPNVSVDYRTVGNRE